MSSMHFQPVRATRLSMFALVGIAWLGGCDGVVVDGVVIDERACEAADCGAELDEEASLAVGGTATAASLFPKWEPGHYVFVGIDPGPLQEKHVKDGFRGVQKAYLWNKIEVARGEYDFSEIDADIALLAEHDQSLVIQIQYKTFGAGTTAVPKYIVNGAAEFGANRTYLSHKDAIYPSIWNKKVGDRMRALITALGERYDANVTVTAVNLPETAQSNKGTIADLEPLGYTPQGYTDAVKQNMLALKQAFPHTVTIQFINYGPVNAVPEWIDYGGQIGVGVGGPDVHPTRDIPGYDHWPSVAGKVPIAGAVQYADYFETAKVEASGIIDPWDTYVFARDDLRLNYMFWATGPSEGFAKASDMINAPTFPKGASGGLPAALPSKLRPALTIPTKLKSP